MEIIALSGVSRNAGGLFYAVRSLCHALVGNNIDVSVFGRNDADVSDDLPSWSPVMAKAFNSYGPLGFSPSLRRSLKKAGCDLVHQHGVWMDDQWAALCWQKAGNRPVVVSPHGMLDPWALKNSAWKKQVVEKLFAREALERATCIHALCRSEAESIRAYGLKNPIAIIPNGVELPEKKCASARVRECGNVGTSELSNSRTKRLLFLGRIHPKKGLKELIKAWGGEGPWHQDWQLVIAGWDDGGHLEGLKRQAAELGLWSEDECRKSGSNTDNEQQTTGNSICFVGPKYGEKKDALLRSVDAFILPSFSEGLPMSVLEAWSYGLPVIMTEFCNIPEGFESKSAIPIEPNPESIASGLNRLFSLSDEELSLIGGNGRQLVEEKFTWDSIALQMKSVYEWCLNGGSVPPCIQLYDD